MPLNNPLISIIVPVYNVEPYLRRCLDSILEQTYNNIEIIIVASTSKDKSVEICEEYKTKDSRITVIHSEPKGLSDARNKGIEAAHGNYLSFIDSDDYISPDFLLTLYNICKNYDCEIAQCTYKAVTTNDNRVERSVCNNIQVYSNIEMCSNFYLGRPENTGCANVVTWSKLYKSTLFEKIRFPAGKINEDQATTYQLFYSAKKIGLTLDALYYYRQVPTSIMGQGFSLKRLDDLEFIEDQLSFFKNKNELYLHSLCLLYYLRYLNEFIEKISMLFPNESLIIDNLKRKRLETIKEIKSNPHLSLKQKVYLALVYIINKNSHIQAVLSKIYRKIRKNNKVS